MGVLLFILTYVYFLLGIGFAQEYSSTGEAKIAAVIVWPMILGAKLAEWCKE